MGLTFKIKNLTFEKLVHVWIKFFLIFRKIIDNVFQSPILESKYREAVKVFKRMNSEFGSYRPNCGEIYNSGYLWALSKKELLEEVRKNGSYSRFKQSLSSNSVVISMINMRLFN